MVYESHGLVYGWKQLVWQSVIRSYQVNQRQVEAMMRNYQDWRDIVVYLILLNYRIKLQNREVEEENEDAKGL